MDDLQQTKKQNLDQDQEKPGSGNTSILRRLPLIQVWGAND